jgi:hypothetical protein
MRVLAARIYLTEADALHNRILAYLHDEAQVLGATSFRAISGFGRSGKMHSSSLLDLSMDLPVVIEFFDEEEKVRAALAHLDELIPPGHVLTFAADLN